MDKNGYSISKLLRVGGCLVFDIAIVIAFIKVFSIFTIINPVKSGLMFVVLLTALLVINCAIFFPYILFKRIGIVYSTSVIILLLAYAVAANIISVAFISGSTMWYIVWELILLAALLGLLSVIALFSDHIAEDIKRDDKEQEASKLIKIQLMELESTIMAKENDEGFLSIINSFKALKERINYSTPFGRFSGENRVMEVLDIENTIKNNLVLMQSKLETDISEEGLSKIKKLMDDTLRLVKSRESLNIR